MSGVELMWVGTAAAFLPDKYLTLSTDAMTIAPHAQYYLNVTSEPPIVVYSGVGPTGPLAGANALVGYAANVMPADEVQSGVDFTPFSFAPNRPGR